MRIIMLIILLTYSSNVWATILPKRFSTDEMVNLSDTIGLGKVTNIRYEFTDTKEIFTYTTISCDTLFKGDESVKNFDVIQRGGKTDKFTTAVYGAPSYEKGEEVILFLQTHKTIKTLKKVVAMRMGKYSIITDEQDGKQYAVTDLSDIHFLREKDHDKHGYIIKKPLNSFIEEIKQAVEKETTTMHQSLGATNKTGNTFDWIKWIQKKCVSTANNLSKKYYTTIAKQKG
ncbi:hypothetical protein J7L67_09730 [bacterium]|nr:hypothetical protein [bacterium]